MGLTPVSANLLGLGSSALNLSGVSGNSQSTTPSSGGATLPSDVAALSSSGNAADGTNPGLYNLPSSVIFRIQLDRLAFESGQTSAALTPTGSASATSNTTATGAADETKGDGKLRKALEALGLDPKTINEFLRIGKLLKRFDPAAYNDFARQIENLASALEGGQPPATAPAPASSSAAPQAAETPQPQSDNVAPATQPAASDSAAAPATPQLQVDLTSFQLTETQIQITDTQGKNGQTLDVSAETLNLNFAEFQAALASGQASGSAQSSGADSGATDSPSQGSKVNLNA